jgi:hypothetical protein
LAPTPGLEGLDHGWYTPRVDLCVACLFQALASLAVCGDRADVGVEAHGLRGGGTDDCREPSEVGRTPGGPAFIAAILAQQEGRPAVLGGLAIAKRLRAGADGLVLDCGDRDRREIPGAQQPGERHRVASVGRDAVPWCLRDARWGHHPAAERRLGEIAVEPRPTGSGLIDQEQRRGLRLACADQGLAVALPGAAGAQDEHLGAPLCRDLGHSDGRLVHIQTHVNGVRVSHG